MDGDLLVGNGALVTFGRENRLLPGAALVLRGGLIAAMGPESALRAAHAGARYVDARGGYIMPGLVCAHTHVYGAFARGMALRDAAPENFVQILERLWWRLDKALGPKDVRYSALVCLVDAIRHGTTTLVDHHASPNAIDGSLDVLAQAFAEAGVRGALCYEVTDRDGAQRAQAGLHENERFLRSLARPVGGLPAMLCGLFGLHASLTLSDETLQQAVGLARSLGVGCHIHLAEDKADEEDSLQRAGVRTVERLNRLGVLGPGTIAAHCVHIDERELAMLRQTETWVAHNPRSNMNNAVGTAPIPDMLAAGVPVCLGNDGFSNDMFVEMTTAYLAHKAARLDPQAMPASDVLQIGVANNAALAGLLFGRAGQPALFGELREGAAADVIVVQYRPPTPLTASNLPWHMLFGMSGSQVTTTIAGGRLLMRDGELVTLDEEAIAARARELAAQVWQRL